LIRIEPLSHAKEDARTLRSTTGGTFFERWAGFDDQDGSTQQTGQQWPENHDECEHCA
jgi:hypothetical protein